MTITINELYTFIEFPKLTLQWNIDSDIENLYTWIYRSYGTPELELLTALPLVNKTSFIDYSVPIKKHYSPIIYKMRIQDARAGLDPEYSGTEYEYVDTDYIGFYTKYDKRHTRIFTEMVRKNKLRLRTTYEGVAVYLYKRKYSGIICPECGDETTRLASRSQCTNCYGTGISGGYYIPYISANAKFIEISSDKIVKSSIGAKLPIGFRVETCPPPILNTGDLIYRPDADEMYVVIDNSIIRYKSQMPTGQTLNTHILERDDVTYKLPKLLT